MTGVYLDMRWVARDCKMRGGMWSVPEQWTPILAVQLTEALLLLLLSPHAAEYFSVRQSLVSLCLLSLVHGMWLPSLQAGKPAQSVGLHLPRYRTCGVCVCVRARACMW